MKKLIEMKLKSIDLLNELEQSKQFEKSDGSIQFTGFNYSFFNKQGKELFNGSLSYCEKKAQLRKLSYIIIK